MKKLWCMVFVLAIASAEYADVLIIANKDVPENSLSQQEIMEIFLCKPET